MIDYIDAKRAAELLGKSGRYVAWLASRGKLPGAKKENGRWLVPRSAHPALAADVPIEVKALEGLPASKREQAIRRLGIISDFERFRAAAEKNTTRSEALAVYVARNGDVRGRTLYRWLERFRNEGIRGLVDMRGGDVGSQMISDDAFELFKSMWLTERRLSVKLCWQNTTFVNADEERGWTMPSLRQMHRLIDDRIPLAVQVLHREGLAAYEAKCAPYIEVDPDSVEPGQVWVGDHSQFNCWIRHRRTWIRPWVTAWEDYRSRAIVGYRISAGPNQTTIMLAAKRAMEEHGPPETVKVDNGKDYDSEMWTGTTKARRRRVLAKGYLDEHTVAGIYAMLGIGISFSIKYHPQSKPLERFFDTADQQFVKTLPTYCGKDTQRRPEQLNDYLKSDKAIHEALDLEGLEELFGKYIAIYNNTAHSGRGMEGMSPSQVLASRSSRRVLADGVLDLLMRVWSGELKVGKNGVRFKGLWYGQYSPALFAHQGKKVRLAYDPDDLRTVHVYDATTWRLLAMADQNQLIAYGRQVDEDALRNAMRQKGRAVKIARAFRDSSLTANTDLASLTMKAMAEAAAPSPAAQAPTLRPVRTPLDGQVKEAKRQQAVRALKRAAGAENMKVALDIDFSVLGGKTETVDLGIFNNG